MLDNSKWSRDNENMILRVRDLLIVEALQSGKHVIVDDTNLAPKHEERLKQLAKGNKVQFEKRFFDVDIEECMKRDLKRAVSVGEKVIRSMYNQFLKEETEKISFGIGVPPAYIFDVDGTLARMNGRSPYEWEKVIGDLPNIGVIRVLDALQKDGYKIIIFTGRDGVCEEDTKKWLRRYDISYDHFDIRPEGNTEKDSIIKRRMVESIKDKYNVLGVFDDRDQVVEMWRSLGLRCFQVDYGNF